MPAAGVDVDAVTATWAGVSQEQVEESEWVCCSVSQEEVEHSE